MTQLQTLNTIAGNYVSLYFDKLEQEGKKLPLPENMPAYIYLAETYLEKILPKDCEPDAIPAEVALKLTNETNQKNLFTLLNGLSNYFTHTDDLQETLIRVNVTAAHQVLIGEALTVALDSHPDINSETDLRREAGKVLRSLSPGSFISNEYSLELAQALKNANSADPQIQQQARAALLDQASELAMALSIPENSLRTVLESKDEINPDLFDAFYNILNAEILEKFSSKLVTLIKKTRDTNETVRINARKHLREELHSIALQLPAFQTDHYETAIAEFRQSREKQTTAVNIYENKLLGMIEKIEQAISYLESLPQPSIKQRDDITTLYDRFLMLHDRVEEVESYRKGIIVELPPQPSALTSFRLNDHRVVNTLNDTAHASEFVFIEDLDNFYRRLDNPTHPLIDRLNQAQNNLEIMVGNSHNPEYREHIPGLEIRESGKKSWRRTIEKLIGKRMSFNSGIAIGADQAWAGMTDLARINVTFKHAETMFHFNDAVRKLSARIHNWQTFSPESEEGPYQDTGPKFRPTGAMNWTTHLYAGEFGDYGPQRWGVEVKLDDQSQAEREFAHHKIFECSRLLEGKRRNDPIDFDAFAANKQKYTKFITLTQRTMELLLKDANLGSDVNKLLNHIKLQAHHFANEPDEEVRTEVSRQLYQELTKAHFTVCCSAAKQSSPSMAALYSHFATALINKKPTAPLDASTISTLMNNYGPIRRERGPIGQYENHHLALIKSLLQHHRDSFLSTTQQI